MKVSQCNFERNCATTKQTQEKMNTFMLKTEPNWLFQLV